MLWDNWKNRLSDISGENVIHLILDCSHTYKNVKIIKLSVVHDVSQYVA